MAATDAEHALAFLAKRQGSGSAPAARWAHQLSLELGWLKPGEARDFVARARDAGLLVEDGDDLRVDLDWREWQVPRRFRLTSAEVEASDPTTEPSPARQDDPFPALVDALAGHRGVAKAVVLDDVARCQDRFGGDLTAEAAVLFLAAEAGMDVRQQAADALARLKASTPGPGR